MSYVVAGFGDTTTTISTPAATTVITPTPDQAVTIASDQKKQQLADQKQQAAASDTGFTMPLLIAGALAAGYVLFVKKDKKAPASP